MTGQTFETGDRVTCLADNDTGVILEYRPATEREPAHYIVEWDGELGPHAHLPAELGLASSC